MNQSQPENPRSPDPLISNKTAGYPMRLVTYLASPLTALAPEEEEDLFRRQDLIIRVCEANNIEIHAPKEATHPTKHPDVPAGFVYSLDREKVLQSDFVIVMTDKPSHGVGIEAEKAANALIPMLFCSPKGQRTSRMLLGIPSLKYLVEVTPETLESEFLRAVEIMRPIIAARREWIQRIGQVPLGARIRQFREDRMGKESLEALAGKLGLKPEELRYIEEKPVHFSNPSAVLLMRVAEVLQVSVAELADPHYVDMSTDRMVEALLSESAQELAKARFGIRREDYKRLLRRKLQDVLSRV